MNSFIELILSMIIESTKIIELELVDIKLIFVCGKSNKYMIPHTFLIVIEDLLNNRFYDEMMTSIGASGSAYVGNNKTNMFQYKIITQAVFDNTPWEKLMQPYWNCKKEDAVQLDIALFKRYHNLKSFY